jgi:hypothetical protein
MIDCIKRLEKSRTSLKFKGRNQTRIFANLRMILHNLRMDCKIPLLNGLKSSNDCNSEGHGKISFQIYNGANRLCNLQTPNPEKWDTP